MEDTDVTDWPCSSLGKKIANLERNLRCLICRDMYENPQSLNCGHSYCSLCIRMHLDRALNSSNSDRCPDCKEKSEIGHLRPNLNLASAILSYKDVRSDLLEEISSRKISSGRAPTALSRTMRASDAPIPLIRIAPQLSFHGKSKKYVKDALERFCSSSNVMPCLDGEQSELERYYREMVHLNNAQVGSAKPLSFDEVVKESKRKYMAVRREARNIVSSQGLVERMRNGEIPEANNDRYLSLVQQVRADQIKLREAAPLPSSSSSSTDDQKSVEYTDGDWRIIMSEKLGRPFFYNNITEVGQFAIPEEFTEAAFQEEEKRLAQICSEKSAFQNPHITRRKRSQEVLDLCESSNFEVAVPTSSRRRRINEQSSQSSEEIKENNQAEDLRSDLLNCHSIDGEDSEKSAEDMGGSEGAHDVPSAVELRDEGEGKERDVINITGCESSVLPSRNTDTPEAQVLTVDPMDTEEEELWTCSACTFRNASKENVCDICRTPSGRQVLRRSQRDGQSGTIMHGFALTQSQRAQQTNFF